MAPPCNFVFRDGRPVGIIDFDAAAPGPRLRDVGYAIFLWLNLGSAVVLPEVFLKAVAVVRNFGHPLDGLVTVNLDKESRYRTLVNVLFRPAAEGLFRV